MQIKIQKWGSYLVIRLPQTLANNMGLFSQSVVELSRVDDEIILKLISSPLVLEQLVIDITNENLHSEVPTGTPVGKESW